MGADVMAEFMGVKVDPLDEAVKADFVKVPALSTVGGEGRPRAASAT